MESREAFTRSVNSMFNRLGTDAFYNNFESPPYLIRVIARRNEKLLELGESRIHAEDSQIEFRVSEVPSPRIGDEIELNGRTYSIEEEPRLDTHHLFWLSEVLPL